MNDTFLYMNGRKIQVFRTSSNILGFQIRCYHLLSLCEHVLDGFMGSGGAGLRDPVFE